MMLDGAFPWLVVSCAVLARDLECIIGRLLHGIFLIAVQVLPELLKLGVAILDPGLLDHASYFFLILSFHLHECMTKFPF